MDRKLRRAVNILALILGLALLTSCVEKDSSPTPIGSEVWETMPQLTYGIMEYGKLQILPWSSGRCEATSYYTMAETDQGYYMSRLPSSAYAYVLFYADKSNLTKWLPVCDSPDCPHSTPACSAHMQYAHFLAKDGKLYYQMEIDGTQYDTGSCWFGLMSMSETGNDITVASTLSDLPSTLSSAMPLLTPHYWLYNVVELDMQGNQIAYTYRLTDAGWEEVAKVENFEASCILRTAQNDGIFGDPVFQNGVLGRSTGKYLLSRGDELINVDLTGLQTRFSYLSGDVLRFFRMNDGYYDVNIKTGEEVKLADAQLENSFASIVLPNCIIESTLMTFLMENNNKNLPAGTEHAMRLFDGETWRDVTLPEELQSANTSTYLWPLSVTSDAIIFYGKDMADYMNRSAMNYYIIDLTAEILAVEHIMIAK